MNKFLKFVLIGAAVVAVVIVAAVVFVGVNLDKIVTIAVEKVGTEVTGTTVALGDVKLSIRDGRGGLYGLTIDNPEGFSDAKAFALDEVSLDIDLASLSGNEIVLKSVVIDGASVSFEEKAGTTNLQKLLQKLESAPDTEPESAEGEPAPTIVIEEFRFTRAQAALSSENLGRDLTVTIPDIVLKDIGRKGAGLTAAELGKQLLTPLVAGVLDGAQKKMLEQVKKEGVGGLLKGLSSRKPKTEDAPPTP